MTMKQEALPKKKASKTKKADESGTNKKRTQHEQKAKAKRVRSEKVDAYTPMSGREAAWIIRRAEIRQAEIAKQAGLTVRGLQKQLERVTLPHVTVLAMIKTLGGKQWLASFRREYREAMRIMAGLEEGTHTMEVL